MTSKAKQLHRITVLCEDIAHHRFIRSYLMCKGIDKRKITPFGNVISHDSSTVLKHYPKSVRDYRRIETWFHSFGHKDCDEDSDYKRVYSNDDAEKAAEIPANDICSKGLPDDAPDSLHKACGEVKRLEIRSVLN